MEIRPVFERLAVAPQLQPDDMEAIRDAGYEAVICNRPDGEEAGQPALVDLRKAAQEAGLAFHHIPVSGGEFPSGAIAAFRAVRKGTEGPVLAYCRTGTRSISLEMLANPECLSVSERLSAAQAAGYDLSALAGQMQTADKTG